MKFLLFVLSSAGVALGDSSDLNPAADLLMYGLNEGLAAYNEGTYKVDGLRTSWLFAGLFPAQLVCEDGFIGDLSSFKRIGDVEADTAGDNIIIKITLTLERLVMGFRVCKLSSPVASTAEKEWTNATAASNTMDAQLTVALGGEECYAHLDGIVLRQLGNVCSVSGGDGFQEIVEQGIAPILSEKIVDLLSHVLTLFVGDIPAKNINICDAIPHYPYFEEGQ